MANMHFRVVKATAKLPRSGWLPDIRPLYSSHGRADRMVAPLHEASRCFNDGFMCPLNDRHHVQVSSPDFQTFTLQVTLPGSHRRV